MIKKNSTFSLLACAAVAALTAWVATGVSVAAQTNRPLQTNLSGTWQLNRDLSDDPEAKFQSMGGGGAHADHGGGAGGHGQAVMKMLNAPIRFVMTQDDQKVVLTEPDGHVRTLPTNNRSGKVDGRDVRTKWENNRLVSETTVGNATLVETYERSPSALQLIVTAKMDMHGQQVIVRRVYDAVTSSK